MSDGDLPRVQQLARKIGAPAVDAVARHGVSEVLEVDANLVGAAGPGTAFEQRERVLCH